MLIYFLRYRPLTNKIEQINASTEETQHNNLTQLLRKSSQLNYNRYCKHRQLYQ